MPRYGAHSRWMGIVEALDSRLFSSLLDPKDRVSERMREPMLKVLRQIFDCMGKGEEAYKHALATINGWAE